MWHLIVDRGVDKHGNSDYQLFVFEHLPSFEVADGVAQFVEWGSTTKESLGTPPEPLQIVALVIANTKSWTIAPPSALSDALDPINLVPNV